MTAQHTAGRRGSALAWGFTSFAAIMMILIGAFHAFMGFVALIQNEFYLPMPDYVVELDATAWGWVHLVAGVVLVCAGFAVYTGQVWGRVIGIVCAALSAMVNFSFIPVYPFWSLLVIAIDVCVIWALAAHGDEFAEQGDRVA